MEYDFLELEDNDTSVCIVSDESATAERQSAQNKNPSKKVLVPLIAGVAALIVILTVVLSVGRGGKNTYTTPLDLEIAEMNAKSYAASFSARTKKTNGFLYWEMRYLYDLAQNNSSFQAGYGKDDYNQITGSLANILGSNYKFHYKIIAKERLEEESLMAAKQKLKDIAANVKEEFWVDEEEWEDIGFSKAEAKEYTKCIESMYGKLKSCEVAEGYALEIKVYLTGSKLDDLNNGFETTVYVYKVNGRWIRLESIPFYGGSSHSFGLISGW